MALTKQSLDRTTVARCLSAHGIAVEQVDPNTLQVAGGSSQPRIVFATTPGEADADSFAARAEGAEQVANAFIYVNQGSDALLAQLESCLAPS